MLTVKPEPGFLVPVFDFVLSLGRSVTPERKPAGSGNEIVMFYDQVFGAHHKTTRTINAIHFFFIDQHQLDNHILPDELQ